VSLLDANAGTEVACAFPQGRPARTAVQSAERNPRSFACGSVWVAFHDHYSALHVDAASERPGADDLAAEPPAKVRLAVRVADGLVVFAFAFGHWLDLAEALVDSRCLGQGSATHLRQFGPERLDLIDRVCVVAPVQFAHERAAHDSAKYGCGPYGRDHHHRSHPSTLPHLPTALPLAGHETPTAARGREACP
jgi:hypothetical protein